MTLRHCRLPVAGRRLPVAFFCLLSACASDPRTLAKGTLAYSVAASSDLIASIELTTAFDLILRTPTATRTAALGPPDRDFVALAIDGAGRRVAVAGLDGTVRLFDDAAAELQRFRLDDAATAVALTPDGTYLLHGSASGILCLRRTADGALLQCVDAHDGRLTALAVDGATAVSAGADDTIVVWAVPSLRVLARRAGRGPLAAQGGRVALRDGTIWRWADGTATAETGPPAVAVAFLPDGKLAGIGADGTV